MRGNPEVARELMGSRATKRFIAWVQRWYGVCFALVWEYLAAAVREVPSSITRA